MSTRTLQQIADELKKAKPGTKTYERLMKELDEICGTQEKKRDSDAEEAWERNKK